jgi:hypothetical protein
MLDKLQPFDLKDVPPDMEWCVYEEERQRGNVLCASTAYKVVLALRWLLSYTQWGYEEDFETYRVYWKTEDDYGFKTGIFLFRKKVEQYSSFDDDLVVVQESLWFRLGTLECNNGKSVIDSVSMPGSPPYDGFYVTFDGHTGVRRLLEDAAYASRATHSVDPIRRWGQATSVLRCHDGITLRYRLKCDYSRVTDIGLEVVHNHLLGLG